MAAKNIFEYAARKKLRFNSNRGVIRTEDLYDLNLEELDKMYRILRKQEKEADEESLLSRRTEEDTKLNVSIEIIKSVVEYKQGLIEKANKRVEKKKQQDKILEILAEKENEDLKSKSAEELRKMLADDDDDSEE